MTSTRALPVWLLLSGLAFTSVASAAPSGKVRLLATRVRALDGVSEAEARVLEQVVLTALESSARFIVTGPDDLAALLNLEQSRQLADCSGESEACVANIAGALGAQLLVTGQVSGYADQLSVSLSLVDVSKGATVGRATRFVPKDREALARVVREAADALVDQWLRPRKPVDPTASLVAGGVAVVAGALAIVFGVGAWSASNPAPGALPVTQAVAAQASQQAFTSNVLTGTAVAAAAVGATFLVIQF